MKVFYLVLLLSFLLPSFLLASGGFGGGGVAQVPQGKDREKYHLGKAVYNLETEIGALDTKKEKEQLDRLEYLQGSLPNSEKQRVNLLALAGKLKPEELEALEYFVSVRFNVKLNK